MSSRAQPHAKHIHNNKNQRRAKMPRRPTLPEYEVFASDYSSVSVVPKRAIEQLPLKSFNIKRFVACRNHQCGKCDMDRQCKFVHLKGTVSLDYFPTQQVHVSYSWRSVDYITFPKLIGNTSQQEVDAKTQEIFVVFPPAAEDDTERVEMVATSRLLLTKGAAPATDRHCPMLKVCPGYYLDRLCKMGSECPHVHVAHIDLTAKDFQRSPCPRYHPKGASEGIVPILPAPLCGKEDICEDAAQTSALRCANTSQGLSTNSADGCLHQSSPNQPTLPTLHLPLPPPSTLSPVVAVTEDGAWSEEQTNSASSTATTIPPAPKFVWNPYSPTKSLSSVTELYVPTTSATPTPTPPTLSSFSPSVH